MSGAMKRTIKAVLAVALAASLAGLAATRAQAQAASDDPPPPSSLANHAVETWAATYLQTDGWTLLTHDLEGAHLASAHGALKLSGGLVETEIRTELFRPVSVGPGPARSGVAHWAVDCRRQRLAVLSMTIYSHNNLKGELARKPAAPRTWQEPNESELVTMGVICKAARTGGRLDARPLISAKPS